MSPICAMCDDPIAERDQMFTLVITDPDDVTAGHLCSLDCLTDYVARVYALEGSDREDE